jgi:hypothetical protein
VVVATVAAVLQSAPASARPTPVDVDVSAWNLPAPSSSAGVRALRLQVQAAGSAPGGYAVCSVRSVAVGAGVVQRVGLTCVADTSQAITVTLRRGDLTATRTVEHTQSRAVGRASDYDLARFNGRVMRWRPCQPVPVRFNPGRAPRPDFVEPGFRYALRQVQQASGIPLRYAGRTSFVPGFERRTKGRGIVVAYARPGRGPQRSSFPQLRPQQVLGIGGWRSDRTGRWIEAGYAVVRRSAATRDELTYIVTMMHEIGHAIGLDHASVRGRQIMAPAESAPGITWGKGDLRGLRAIGPRRAC